MTTMSKSGPKVTFKVAAPNLNNPAPAGRPSTYTAEMGEMICTRIAMGESVRAICNDPEMPASATVYRWVVSNAEFGEMYARARDAQADSLFDEAGDVARQALAGAVDPQAARLFVDTVKWQAMKLKPRKYGDKLEVEQNLSVRSVTLADELEAITQRQRRMAAEAAAKTTIIDGTCRVIDPHQRA